MWSRVHVVGHNVDIIHIRHHCLNIHIFLSTIGALHIHHITCETENIVVTECLTKVFHQQGVVFRVGFRVGSMTTPRQTWKFPVNIYAIEVPFFAKGKTIGGKLLTHLWRSRHF